MGNEINQYIDVDSGLARVRGNKKLFCRMLDLFLEGKEFENLEDSLSSQDLEEIEKYAHAIKGISGNLSLIPLFEISSKLMSEARSGSLSRQTVESYREILKCTRACVEVLIPILKSEIQ